MTRLALSALLMLVFAACGDQVTSATTAASPSSVATTASSAPVTTTSVTTPSTQGMEPAAFDDVLAVWNANATRDVSTVYASEARVFDIEAVAASGIAAIGELASTYRGADNLTTLVTSPTTVFETDSGLRYEVAAVESRRPADSVGNLEVVVLKWVDDLVVSHWRLPIPDAAQGTYDSEVGADAVALVERMTGAWDDGDTSAAEEVYAADVRVHWFGESVSEGIEELQATIEEAHGIGNGYAGLTTPTAVVETDSGRTFVVGVISVTGVAHPNGSVVIDVAEVAEGRIVVWSVFFTENLPPD